MPYHLIPFSKSAVTHNSRESPWLAYQLWTKRQRRIHTIGRWRVMGIYTTRSYPTGPGRQPIWTAAAIAVDASKAIYHNGSKRLRCFAEKPRLVLYFQEHPRSRNWHWFDRDRWPHCLNGLPTHQTTRRIVGASTAAFNENYYILHYCFQSVFCLDRKINTKKWQREREKGLSRRQAGARAWLIYVISHSFSFFPSCDYGGVWEFPLGNFLKI